MTRNTLCAFLFPALAAMAGCAPSDGDGDENPASGGAQTPAVDAGPPPPAEAMGLLSLSIEPTRPRLVVGQVKEFRAYWDYADRQHIDLTRNVSWESSDPAVLEFSTKPSEKGHATVLQTGRVSITARIGETETTLTVGEGVGGCPYPEYDTEISLGKAVPPMYWDNAHGPDGRPFAFRFDELACDESKNIVVLVLGAAWCGACSAYSQRLASEAPALEAAGVQIVYAELQDMNYEIADSAFAWEHLANIIGSAPGVRVGDADTKPGMNFLTTYAELAGLPTVYIIRRSDMKVITTGDRVANFSLVDVAMDPDADWVNPGVPDFVGNCGAADEENGEPNDAADDATPLALGLVEGGVCDATGDFYQIDHAGAWSLNLEFDASAADLDVLVWDPQTNEPLRIGGNQIGSENTGMTESFSHTGPALIKVYGFQQASGTYALTLSAN